MSEAQSVQTGYSPRSGQKELHESLKGFNVIICHRRWGKTVFSINEMIDQGLRLYTSRGLTNRPRPRFAYIAPTYGQAKKIAWDYFKSFCSGLPGVTVNEAELRIDISLYGDPTNTLRFQLLGAENPASLKGIYLDGVILDEYAEMLPRTWTEAIRPTLSDRKGWAIFIGTPKGRNHFYEIHDYASGAEGWFTKIFKASDTGIIDPKELEEARRIMPEEVFNQEYECSFEGSTLGSYYGDLMRDCFNSNRIINVPYDPAIPVHTAWDLGIGDEMVIWFYQRVFKEIHVIDYWEKANNEGLPEAIKVIQEKKYIYGTHFWPHDGGARELTTGKTRQETAEKLGLRPLHVAARLPVEDGIDAVRRTLPRCWFDDVKTKRGRVCLEEYKKKFDEKLGTFLPKPIHDQYSHGADGFRTLAMTLDMEMGSRENLPEYADSEYDPFSRRHEYGRSR